MESKNEGEKVDDLDNVKLNDMFSLTYNFDILKYIINNLIKNQQKLNYKLIELKIDKVNNEEKIDELESGLMDLQQEKNGSKNDKKNKNKKNYKDIIKQLTKEKDNYFQLLKNSNQENIILNGRTQKLEEEIKQDKELTAKMNEDLQEDINEIYKRMDELKEEIEVKVNDNIKKLDSKIEDIDKNISLINNDLKTQDDKINKKLSEEISKLFGSLFTEKTNEINSSIDNLDKSIKQNNNNFESFKKLANEKFELLEQKFQDNLQDNQKVFKEIFKQTSQIEKRLDDFVELKTYNPKIKEIENKILNNYRELSNEIMQVSQIAEKNETAISDMKNDKTNKNNIILLSNKIDNLNDEISKLNDEVILFDSDRKKLDEINPNDYVYKNDFEDFIESNKKTIENLKKYTYEIRSMIDDIKIGYSKGRVTLKDLKNLEDKIISKMMEFGEEINEKFAEKKFVLRNNRFLKVEINQKLDNYKSNEQKTEGTSGWLLSKKPIGGHLCASCESYIGDLQDNERYIPWNKIPTKGENDKLSKANPILSKMLQKLSTDYKIKRNNSTAELYASKLNNENSLEETDNKINLTNLTNKRKMVKLKDNITEKNIKKKMIIKEIPKLKLVKKDLSNTNKYKINYDISSNIDKDEIVILPDNVIRNNKIEKEDDNIYQPKVMRIFKKLV